MKNFNYLPNQYRKDKKNSKLSHSYLVEQFSDYSNILNKITNVIKNADYTLGDEVNKFEKTYLRG